MLAEPRDPTVTTFVPVDDECRVTWHEDRLVHPVSPINTDEHVTGCHVRIGECWIEGLPMHLPSHSPIQVRCGVATNGLIDVMALDMTSGKMARTEIHRSSGLSEEEIAREAEWVRSLKIQ